MAATFSSSQKRYEVFLSFRGDDTRNNFTAHLLQELRTKGINTFFDEDKLEKGRVISPALITAIENSMFSIIVLSENYASSRWCLEEMVKILECNRSKEERVLPIFYNVDPSDVRNHRGNFGEALAKHEENLENRERVRIWRDALTYVGKLSGWDTRNKNEPLLIKDIVGKLLKKLNTSTSDTLENQVGIQSRIQKLRKLLCLQLYNVRMVGICGLGGIGKTTLARAIYSQIFDQFEAYSFLEIANDFKEHDLTGLEEKLLSQLLEEKNLEITESTSIKARLRLRKVLIVLDNVNNLSILERLAGNQDWFDSGSRIIVTTRDKSLLIQHKVEYYEVAGFNDGEVLEFLKHYSLKYELLENDFIELSKEVIRYAQGLPLALKVLAPFLFSMSKDKWRDYLDKLKGSPHPRIQEALQISYDGLDDNKKNIFLDIACFFKGEDKDHVVEILKGCGFFTDCGIETLINKSLITINFPNTLEMHDLIQEMGKHIVCQECPTEPGRRSRLWKQEDILNVLKENMGSENIQGIFLDLSHLEDILQFTTEAFAEMKKLRLLKVYNSKSISSDFGETFNNKVNCRVQFAREFKFCSNYLRYLRWDGYSLKSLPNDFSPKHLVELNMPYSHIKKLWKGIKVFERLKFMDLSHSKYLIQTPDFSGITNLERLVLEGCINLREVHPSLGDLKKLNFLSLKNCKMLRRLPSSNCNLKSLETFILSGCSEFEEFSENFGNLEMLKELHADGIVARVLPPSLGDLKKLNFLSLKNCKMLRRLPSSTCNLKSLETFILSGCSEFEEFPENFGNLEMLKELHADGIVARVLPPSLGDLKKLNFLSLKNCKMLRRLPSSTCNLKSLETFILSGCSKFEEFPENFGNLEMLKELHADGIVARVLPPSLGDLKKLNFLSLKNCKMLRRLPSSTCNLKSLETFILSGCSKVEEFPENFGNLEMLKELHADGIVARVLPPSLGDLKKLNFLSLKNCKMLRRLPSSTCNLKSLETFILSGCSEFEEFPENFGNLEMLKELHADGIVARVLPPSLGDLKKLNFLSLKNCKMLRRLPSSTCNLKSLETFILSGCSEFEEFPENFGNLEMLKELHADGIVARVLPPSLGDLKKLNFLSLKNCKMLRRLPSSTCNLKSLETFILSGCSKFEEFPENFGNLEMLKELHADGIVARVLPPSLGDLKKLNFLSLKNCKMLRRLPSSTCNLKSLETFILSGCSKFEEFPENFGNLEMLKELHADGIVARVLPPSLGDLKKLNFLSLKNCKMLRRLPSSTCNLKSLETFILSGCSKFEEFPENFGNLEMLKELHADGIVARVLPPSLGDLKKLNFLSLKNCKMLRRLPSSTCNLKSLETFILSGCSKFEEFPENFGNLEMLKELHADGIVARVLPPSLGDLKKLNFLSLKNCKMLRRLPSSTCNLKSLETFILSGCSKFEEFPENFGNLEMLKELHADGIVARVLPPSFISMRNLEKLSFRGCKEPASASWWWQKRSSNSICFTVPSSSNLCSLVDLDLTDCNISDGANLGSLGSISSLKALNLSGNNIVTLPNMSALSHLTSLALVNCKRLQALPQLPSSISGLIAANCTSLGTTESLNWLRTVKVHTPLRPRTLKSVDWSLGVITPGSRIPDWIRYQSSENVIEVDLLLNWSTNRLGFALALVFVPQSSAPCDCSFSAITTLEVGTCFRRPYHNRFYRGGSCVLPQHVCYEREHVLLNYVAVEPSLSLHHQVIHIKATFEMDCGYEIKRCGLGLMYVNEEVNCNNVPMTQFSVPPLNNSTLVLEEISAGERIECEDMTMTQSESEERVAQPDHLNPTFTFGCFSFWEWLREYYASCFG